MKIAKISAKSKKFRVSNSMASTCNCGACNCNCGSGSNCSNVFISHEIATLLNSQVAHILNA